MMRYASEGVSGMRVRTLTKLPRVTNGVIEWPCAKCKEYKATEFFRKSKTALNGLGSYCRDCEALLKRPRAKKQRVPKVADEIRSGVYIIKAETLRVYKVGWASDVARRLRHMRIHSPDRLTLVALRETAIKSEEARLHVYLKGARLHGEWFRETKRVLELVERYKTTDIKSARLYKRVEVHP